MVADLEKIHRPRNREQTVRGSRNGARGRSYRRASTKDRKCDGRKNAFLRPTAETRIGACLTIQADRATRRPGSDSAQRTNLNAVCGQKFLAVSDAELTKMKDRRCKCGAGPALSQSVVDVLKLTNSAGRNHRNIDSF